MIERTQEELKAEFDRTAKLLDGMVNDGLSGAQIFGVILCAAVQTCLNTHDPIGSARKYAKEIERLTRANVAEVKRMTN